MTKKTLFSSGEGQSVLLGQHVPQRRAREDSDEDSDKNEPHYGSGNGTQRLGYSLLNHMSLARSENAVAMTSPATETVTSPSVGYMSYTDALSPAPVFTPSAIHAIPESSQQPTRKRARTMSNSENTAKPGTIGPRKNDLAGLLNPVDVDDTHVYSPQLKISDLDNPDTTMTDHEYGSSAMTIAVSSGHRLVSARPFVEIQPRPAGQDTRMDDTEIDRRVKAEDSKRKGRRGPLENDQRRAEVLEVREIGACLRCHVMRIRCTASPDEACSNCKLTLPKSRKWMIPCTREWLRSRWHCLIPEMLSQRHDATKSIPTIPTIYLGPSFKLPLTHRSGFKFEIDARTVRVSPEQKANFNNFTYEQQGEGPSAVTFLETSAGWPLVPTMRPGVESYDHTVRMIEHHLQRQMENTSKRWIANFLPARRGQHWAREILQLVMYFQAEVLQSQVLKDGFDILFVRYLQNHTFFIPLDRIAEVNNELPEEDQRSWTQIREIRENQDEECPKYVNRWLKSALLKIYERRLPVFFLEIEALFKLQESTGDQAVKMSSLDRDEAFAALVLALMLIATAQVKILQAGIAWDEELPSKAERYLKQSAREAILEMETRLVDHCLQLYKYRFYKESMKGKVPPERQTVAEKASRFNVIGEFDRLRMQHEDSVVDLSTELDLSDGGEHHFMTQNHTRVLKKLSESVWRPKSPRR